MDDSGPKKKKLELVTLFPKMITVTCWGGGVGSTAVHTASRCGGNSLAQLPLGAWKCPPPPFNQKESFCL